MLVTCREWSRFACSYPHLCFIARLLLLTIGVAYKDYTTTATATAAAAAAAATATATATATSIAMGDSVVRYHIHDLWVMSYEYDFNFQLNVWLSNGNVYQCFAWKL